MIKIVADTTACLSPEIINRYQIPIVPQVINFGNESFQEGIDIDQNTFLQRLKSSSELPKTAAPLPEMFQEIFAEYVPTGATILCIHPSMEVSGTVRSATIAADDFPGADIRIIDSRTVAGPLGSMVTLAAAWAEEGLDADQICARIDQLITKSRIFFLVETLEYLAKGGRIGGASALVGTLLQIKPILVFEDGKVDQYERERTFKRAIQRLKQLVITQIDHDGFGYPSIFHADNLDTAIQLAADLKPALGVSEIPISGMPPAIVTHAGPGTIGVGFFRP